VCFVLVAIGSSLLPITDLEMADAANPGENGRVAYVDRLPVGDGSLGTYSEVFTMEPDGSDRRRVTFTGGVFVKYVDEEEYLRRVYTQNGGPRWLTGGSTLAYVHYSTRDEWEVRLLDPVTGDDRLLFPDWEASMISWSPDGRNIAYGDRRGVWVANADGTNPQLIAMSSDGLWPLDQGYTADVHSVSWSPDGSRIAYVEDTGQGMVAGAQYLSVVNLQPLGIRNLTDRNYWVNYDWAPDGESLVVAEHHDGLIEIELGPFDTSEVALTSDWGRSPAWSPDGTTILYVVDEQLQSYDAATGSSTPVLEGFSGGALEWQSVRPLPRPVGLVDPHTGVWRVPDSEGVVTSFYYGNPGDVPFLGDWDCDGIETPGLFRTSDAFAYLRNSNTQGNADIRFFFGNPSDIPLAGDFNGDGCDTLSVYRPSEAKFYIMNALGENEGGLGAADYSFLFGNVGDKPVVGDWDGDGIDEIGLHRELTGFLYYRNTLTTGVADGQLFFGDPGDRFVAGDWGVVDGVDTPGMFRPSNSTFYFRHTLTQGNADSEFTWTGAGMNWLPVSGDFTLD
jgi:Tol biopolymer transport system component